MKRILGAVVGAVVLGAAPVQAQFTSQLCALPSYGVCGIARFELTNANTLIVSIYNGATATTAGRPSSLTELLFFNARSGVTPSLSSVQFYDWTGSGYSVGNISSGYSLDTDPNGGGWKVNADFSLGTKGNSGITSCAGAATDLSDIDANVSNNPDKFFAKTCNGVGDAIFGPKSDFVLFTFALSGVGYTNADLLKLDWGFHAQMLDKDAPDGSVWCVGDRLDPRNEKNCTPFIDDFGEPETIVPEPATMTLLATGLVGLAASRRRKKNAV